MDRTMSSEAMPSTQSPCERENNLGVDLHGSPRFLSLDAPTPGAWPETPADRLCRNGKKQVGGDRLDERTSPPDLSGHREVRQHASRSLSTKKSGGRHPAAQPAYPHRAKGWCVQSTTGASGDGPDGSDAANVPKSDGPGFRDVGYHIDTALR